MGSLPKKFKPEDFHLLVSGAANKAKLFDAEGREVKEFDCFPHGATGPSQDIVGGDTVVGVYTLGPVVWTLNGDDLETVKRPYGWAYIYMGDLEGKEAAVDRAGEGVHGGGHIQDYWDAHQQLTYTHGCVRLHNEDVKWLAHLVEVQSVKKGTVYMSVSQT